MLLLMYISFQQLMASYLLQYHVRSFRMMYLLAILLPPLAVLFVGKPFQAILNFILTLFFWLPGAIHAVLLVHEKKADDRMKKQARLIAEHRNRK